jgi:hypothetical protein
MSCKSFLIHQEGKECVYWTGGALGQSEGRKRCDLFILCMKTKSKTKCNSVFIYLSSMVNLSIYKQKCCGLMRFYYASCNV